MKADKTMLARGRLLICVHLCSSVVVLLASGCGSPNKANIELRKQNQDLRAEVERLNRQHEADVASIAALQRDPSSSAAQLAPAQLDKLFSVAGLRLGNLTGGYETDAARPGDDAIRVQAVPIDAEGDPIKASGAFLIEAFDLSGDAKLLGRWEFDVSQARRQWHGAGMLYCYLFTLPLSQPPVSPQVTLKVTFTDELTGRQFSQQRPISLRLAESAR